MKNLCIVFQISMERTFLLILPEWVKLNMVGRIITRFENLSLKLVYLRMVKLDEDKDLVSLTSHVSVHLISLSFNMLFVISFLYPSIFSLSSHVFFAE